jgi:prevent-host-death family protein
MLTSDKSEVTVTDVPSSRRRALPVGEAKRRFSELIDRVENGEQILISRRGTVVVALVPPRGLHQARSAPVGLAAVAGALADWRDLDSFVAEVYASRRRSRDRAGPDLD